MSDDAPTLRLFLALLPGPAEQEALSQEVAAWHWPERAAIYTPADWHLTLHFLGPVPADRLPDLHAGLALPMQPFVLSFGQPALWPQGVAVLLPHAVPDALLDLHAALAQRLQTLELRTESRSYQPHITLARHAGVVLPPQTTAGNWSWPVSSYALMLSTGLPQARYRVLHRFSADLA